MVKPRTLDVGEERTSGPAPHAQLMVTIAAVISAVILVTPAVVLRTSGREHAAAA